MRTKEHGLPITLNACRESVLQQTTSLSFNSLANEPPPAALLHLRGLLAIQEGYDDVALACLTRATALDSQVPRYFTDLAAVLARKGRHADAVRAQLGALRLAPAVPQIYRDLARNLRDTGRAVEALAMCREALVLQPDHPSTLIELAELLHAQGRSDEAIERCERAIRLDAASADAHRTRGRIWMSRGRFDLAVQSCQQGLSLLGDGAHRYGVPASGADLYRSLGQALFKMGSVDDAIEMFKVALNLQPKDEQACRELALACELRRDTANVVGVWASLGEILWTQGRLSDAVVAYQQAIRHKPNCFRALISLGRIHLALGQPDRAATHLRAAVAVHPTHKGAHAELGRALYLLEDFDAAWGELAWLYPRRATVARLLEQPWWDGGPLDGGTILLWAPPDQPPGEVIDSLRYVRAVKALGARIVVECPREVATLLHANEDISIIVPAETPLPRFDTHLPLAAVPVVLKTVRWPVPSHASNLSVPHDKVEIWRTRLVPDGRVMIGVTWGSDIQRNETGSPSVPLNSMAALAAKRPEIRLVSLQTGPLADELVASLAMGNHIECCLDSSSRLDDVAALVQSLDLIITVDSAIAHLGGALAKPVWTLLSSASHYRWLRAREDAAGYSTMRLFRQARAGDWAGVFERVSAALEDFSASKRASTSS